MIYKPSNPMLKKGLPVSLLLIAMLPHTGHSSSFNCAKPKQTVDALVCKDKILLKKDETVISLYQGSLKKLQGEEAKRFKADHQKWEELRNSCTSFECLDYFYAKRIYELKS